MSKTINGRAAICQWDLTLTFIDKEQAVAVVNELLKQDIDFPVSYRSELTNTRTVYLVEIDNMAWANNLATVADIARAVDYDSAPTPVGAA